MEAHSIEVTAELGAREAIFVPGAAARIDGRPPQRAFRTGGGMTTPPGG